MHRSISSFIGALLAGIGASAGAEELAIGNYGVSANGMPFGVALAKGYFKDEGAQCHRAHLVRRRRHVAAQHAGRWRRAVWRSQSGRRRLGDPGGRRPQDRQRQRADRRRVRMGGEARFADQDDQGPQGQEDRLHQPALDQPGAGHHAAADRRATSRRMPSWSRPAASAKASPRSTPGQSTSRRSPSRCGRSSRASTAPSSSPATRCRRWTTSSAWRRSR